MIALPGKVALIVRLFIFGAIAASFILTPIADAQNLEAGACSSKDDCADGYYCRGLKVRTAGNRTEVVQAGTCTCAFGIFEAPLPGFGGANNICDFVNNNEGAPFLAIIKIIVNVISGLIIGAAIVMIVVAGYIYMTAGGDASRIGLAKKIIGGALLGIVLALTAFILLNTLSPQFASEATDPVFGP